MSYLHSVHEEEDNQSNKGNWCKQVCKMKDKIYLFKPQYINYIKAHWMRYYNYVTF